MTPLTSSAPPSTRLYSRGSVTKQRCWSSLLEHAQMQLVEQLSSLNEQLETRIPHGQQLSIGHWGRWAGPFMSTGSFP